MVSQPHSRLEESKSTSGEAPIRERLESLSRLGSCHFPDAVHPAFGECQAPSTSGGQSVDERPEIPSPPESLWSWPQPASILPSLVTLSPSFSLLHTWWVWAVRHSPDPSVSRALEGLKQKQKLEFSILWMRSGHLKQDMYS